MDKGRNWKNNNLQHGMAQPYQDVGEESYNAYIQNAFDVTQEPLRFNQTSTGGSDEQLSSRFRFVNDKLEGERRKSFQCTQATKNVMDILSGTCSYLTETENMFTKGSKSDQIYPSFDDPYNSPTSMTTKHHRLPGAVGRTFTDSVKTKKPTAHSLKGSSLNKLEIVSKHNKLPAPAYNLVPRKQTEQDFVAGCEFLDYVETECSHSQNETREETAVKMLKKLHIEDDSTSEDDCSFGHSFQYNANKKDQKGLQDKTQKCKAPHLQESNSNLRGFEHCQGDQKLQQKSDSESHYPFTEFYMRPTGNKQYVWLLESVASKMNFKVRYEIVPLLTSNSLAQCLVHLCRDPPVVCYGSAKSENKAKSSAARCAFEYLKTYHK